MRKRDFQVCVFELSEVLLSFACVVFDDGQLKRLYRECSEAKSVL